MRAAENVARLFKSLSDPLFGEIAKGGPGSGPHASGRSLSSEASKASDKAWNTGKRSDHEKAAQAHWAAAEQHRAEGHSRTAGNHEYKGGIHYAHSQMDRGYK